VRVPKLLRTTALAAGLIAASVPSLSVPANAAWGAVGMGAGGEAGMVVAGDGAALVSALPQVRSSEQR
jgi:hypothetical protein